MNKNDKTLIIHVFLVLEMLQVFYESVGVARNLTIISRVMTAEHLLILRGFEKRIIVLGNGAQACPNNYKSLLSYVSYYNEYYVVSSCRQWLGL